MAALVDGGAVVVTDNEGKGKKKSLKETSIVVQETNYRKTTRNRKQGEGKGWIYSRGISLLKLSGGEALLGGCIWQGKFLPESI